MPDGEHGGVSIAVAVNKTCGGAMSMRYRRLKLFVVSALLLVVAQAARSQAYPERPVRFIVATSAGAAADVLARVLAEAMMKPLGQPIIVEAKPGADQIIGMEYLARGAPADGYTVGVIGIDGQVQLPLMKKGLRFDPIGELTSVAGLGELRYVVAGPASAPYRTFKEFIDAIKSQPGKFNYGASGPQVRFPSLVLMQDIGLDMVYIPYAGGGPYLTAIAGGTIDWGVISETSGNSLKPRVRFYGITGRSRSPANPEVPTFVEMGHPRIFGPAYALTVRKGTPQAAIDKLSSVTGVALASPELRASAQKLQFDVHFENAEAAVKTLQERSRFYQEQVKKLGIQPE
jgi:tripartite-type tricarboxylate transporter receptor subunit TctC